MGSEGLLHRLAMVTGVSKGGKGLATGYFLDVASELHHYDVL